MTAARRDRYAAPVTGADSRLAVKAAVESLCTARDLGPPDATARLHLLVSVAAEIHAQLGSAVADARSYGCSWAEIADLLGVTRASAWQRYAERERRPSNDD